MSNVKKQVILRSSLILLLGWQLTAFSQNIELSLSNSGACLFRKQLFVFGLRGGAQTSLWIFKIQKAMLVDSIEVKLDKDLPENYLAINSDTLHGFLNIHLQVHNKKFSTIVRVHETLGSPQKIDNVPVERLNNRQMLGLDHYYYKNLLYTIITESDSSGKQFYLNKYLLKSGNENFDYQFAWQFPFDKKDIQTAHVFFAEGRFVYVMAWRKNESGQNQWILKIDQQQGKLVKASKLNDKGEVNQFGQCFFDGANKDLYLLGQKFAEKELDAEGRLHLQVQPQCRVYLCRMDSTGEMGLKEEFVLPVPKLNTVSKTPPVYILKFSELRGNKNELNALADIYKAEQKDCYHFTNTVPLKMTHLDDKYVTTKLSIGPQQDIEGSYNPLDKTEMRGKICYAEKPGQEIFYHVSPDAFKSGFKTDSLANPVWLLNKADHRKKSYQVLKLGPEKGVYRMKELLKGKTEERPQIFVENEKLVLLFRQKEIGICQVLGLSW
jgi:hypothetical protein